MAEKKEAYKKSIIKQLYFGNTLSSADISERVKKSLPLVAKMLQELIKEEYILETGLAPSSGGRRALTYRLQPEMLYVVAVAMDQHVTRIVMVNMHNRYVAPVETFELDIEKNRNALQEVTQKINDHIASSGIDKAKVAGIGIGMPGFVDGDKGINYSFFDAETDIRSYIAGQTGLDVFIDNDSSLIALAELRFGTALNKRNAMVINIGWGVGLGLILNGQMFRGENGFAGEFSHMSLFTNNRLCSVCGKTGCLETETSLSVMVEKARLSLASGTASWLKNEMVNADNETAFSHIMKAAAKGDQLAIELFSQAGYNIGKGVAILIHLINPKTVVLSGRGSLAGNIWKAPIQQALNAHCIPRLAAATEIELSSLGYEAELIGAAALVMENYEKGTNDEAMDDEVPQKFYAVS